MVEINYYSNDFSLKINTNSNLGKKILNLIKKTKEEEEIIIKFNSAKSFNSKNINSIPNANFMVFGNDFDTPIDLSKYIQIKEVLFGRSFNSNITWSNFIEKIIFPVCSAFNQKINDYPIKLKYLEFGTKFNQEVNNLPNSLKYLKFGCEFNKNLNNLPNGLEKILLGPKFNQELNFLPESLITLQFDPFTQLTIGLDNLPNNLQELSIPCDYKYNLDNLPDNIKYLKLPKLPNISKLPNKIEKLEIKFDFFSKLIGIINYENIKELIINDPNNANINFIDELILIKNNISNISKIYIYGLCSLFFLKNINKINNIYKISDIEEMSGDMLVLEKINDN